MMSGMPLKTCSAFNKRLNNKFYYKVASCWLFPLIQLENVYLYLQSVPFPNALLINIQF